LCSILPYESSDARIMVTMDGVFTISRFFDRWVILGTDILHIEWICAANFFFENGEGIIGIWKRL
jgi:hypothetical protein